jgi:cell division protein FtsB
VNGLKGGEKMEESARKFRQQNNYYDGNAVRKLKEYPEEEYYQEQEPEMEYPEIENDPRVRRNPGVQRNPEVRRTPGVHSTPRVHRRTKEKQALNIFSVLFLTVAICGTLYTCIGYLKVQTEITQKNDKIASLERKLSKLVNDNDASLAKIDTSVDLNYIYNYATNELGMVYPSDKQVITFKNNESDYVKQYADIPQADESTILDKLKKQN